MDLHWDTEEDEVIGIITLEDVFTELLVVSSMLDNLFLFGM